MASDFHKNWSIVKGPRFKRGDRVKIPHFTPGHDSHDPEKIYVVKNSRAASYDGFHEIEGLRGQWPGTRLQRG